MSPDNGLFGPGSVSWRVHSDPVMWVAAFYALAIQSLHPHTLWGTYQHSTLFVRKHALARLFRTADYVSTRTFGSTAEVERAGRRVRAIHDRLRGRDLDTGEEYRLDEPVNLMWVHCGEVLAYLRVAQRAGVPLTAADTDAYVDEQRRAAAVVGLDPATVPGSVAELEAYFERMRPQLRLTKEAVAGIRMWLVVPAPPRLAALLLVYPVLAGLAFALLPPWARRLYRLPATLPGLDAAATLALRAVRRVMLVLPARYRGTTLQIRHIRTARALEHRPNFPTVLGGCAPKSRASAQNGGEVGSTAR
ncbi:oxygenase MpaB family protein [Pseudonocardia sp. TRM90224]|uniref:oxygenase MpaB family protein n=1 Tax=Pseudonocardia sp. TRM90224 TaxID=2812678 RepID=UPI001E28BC02|nr:oxygenase MpaB family protein [Pseudonocardia sp. TRM90224]